MKHLFIRFMCFFIMLGNISAYSDAVAGEKESKLKTIFLYQFLKLVTWPEGINTMNICIVGDDPFGKSLNKLEKKTVKKSPIKIVRNISYSAVQDCQIIFISRSESRRLSLILSSINDIPALTVSDIVSFSNRGGMVEFIPKKGKIGILINQTLARQHDLNINAKLLEFADKVM